MFDLSGKREKVLDVVFRGSRWHITHANRVDLNFFSQKNEQKAIPATSRSKKLDKISATTRSITHTHTHTHVIQKLLHFFFLSLVRPQEPPRISLLSLLTSRNQWDRSKPSISRFPSLSASSPGNVISRFGSQKKTGVRDQGVKRTARKQGMRPDRAYLHWSMREDEKWNRSTRSTGGKKKRWRIALAAAANGSRTVLCC
jgi:hypothetical protein